MIINIKSEKLELTDAIKNYLEKKINALEKKTKQKNIAADAIIGKTTSHHQKGDYFKAEIKLIIPGKIFIAKVEKDDLYTAIDEVQGVLKKEVIKYKEKLVSKHHKS